MGFVADVVKGALNVVTGGAFSQESPSVQTVKTDPTPVSMNDVSADTGKDTLATKRRKRQGFDSTQTLAASTTEDQKRTTLG